MDMLPDDMRACIEACLSCYSTCLAAATHHCLPAGGTHTEAPHFRLMLACAEACRASAHLMLLGTADHKLMCRACAKVCSDCALSCEVVGGMEKCVQSCRTCAESCIRMAA